jgi:hypothetical protein
VPVSSRTLRSDRQLFESGRSSHHRNHIHAGPAGISAATMTVMTPCKTTAAAYLAAAHLTTTVATSAMAPPRASAIVVRMVETPVRS